MHTHFLHTQSNESSTNASNKVSPAKNSISKKSASNDAYPTSKPPPGLPPELEDYLTTTDKPHEIFAAIQESRDRRIRLLLRRFTNQIQYGCKNPYCNITTCLSYRKRHATTPVRPYSDVVARSLAYRCVEEYADAGKLQAWNEKSYVTKRGASKTLNEDVSGLCWNEPVVPWYDDPTEAGRRTRSSTVKQVSRQDVNRHGVESQLKLHADKENGYVETLPLETDNPAMNGTHLQDTSEITKSRSKKQRQVLFADPLESNDNQEHSPIKDTASFTQTLFNTSQVKRIDHVDSIETNTDENRSKNINPHLSNSLTSGPSSSVITFKTLPLSALLWMRLVMLSDQPTSLIRDLNVAPNLDQYNEFAHQSVYYCLSSPTILLESVSSWKFINRHPHRIGEEKRKQIIRELAFMEKAVQKSQGSTQLPQPSGIIIALGMLLAITSIPEVLNHLFAALQHAYILPPWLVNIRSKTGSSAKSRVSSVRTAQKKEKDDVNDKHDSEFLDDKQVARLSIVIILALQLLIVLKPQGLTLPNNKPLKGFEEPYSTSRKSGMVFPQSILYKAWSKGSGSRPYYGAYMARLDIMDQFHFQRLLEGLTDMISHRLAVTEIQKANFTMSSNGEKKDVIDNFIEEMMESLKTADPIIHKLTLQMNIIDLLRSVVLKRWDRGPIIKRRGSVSGALELLAAMFRKRIDLGLPANAFQWSFIGDSFDEINMPIQWLDFRADNVQTHMLSYSFLFEPHRLVTYFRAINSMIMKKAHETASAVLRNAQQALRGMPINIYGSDEILTETRPNMAQFFVLTIRRDNILQDAMNQIWRRQRQELMRPLKVRLGITEGEDGLDHGGVQAEFFRMVFAEALDPKYGMFTVDGRTWMSWFQPGSLEPLHKFEAIGILMSLAVYNGVTLPITFPLAFYRIVLGLKVKALSHIQDGWPDLARGLQQLLDWNDGDVGDTISRTYEFSYEVFGKSYTVDMTKDGRHDQWPPVDRKASRDKLKSTSFEFPANHSPTPPEDDLRPGPKSGQVDKFTTSPVNLFTSISPDLSDSKPSSQYSEQSSEDEAPLVTNENRVQYVKDYILWLTSKSISPQLTAFMTGFYTCLNPTALSIFTPEHLKTVIEGHQIIDIDGLQATTTYDEYKSTDEIIQWFWQVVRDMSFIQHKKLLEFVTASDRVPVNGIDSVVFIIQRNGESNERLPSSSTCYGRLLLPKYSTKQILKEKLEKAIENSIGFGSL